MSKYNFGKGSLSYLDNPHLHPQIKVFMLDVLKESKYDISIIDGARNTVCQRGLFKKGVTELDGINDLSDHQIEKYDDFLGRAIDIIPYVPHLHLDIWNVLDNIVAMLWGELFRAILRVDRLWKQKGVDVGLELGWTYNIGKGRDYPHVSFKLL